MPDTCLGEYEQLAASSRRSTLSSTNRFNGLEPERSAPPAAAGGMGAEKLTVLVVDDDVSIAELLADLLGDEGYRVIVAYDGLEALAAARREHPAMILSDCMMPGLSGAQMLRELRGHPATRSIVVALMSTVRPHRPSMPDVPFLAKPFEIEDVLALVARCTASSSLTLYGEG
jgi:CheY-like chemotaxis protein